MESERSSKAVPRGKRVTLTFYNGPTPGVTDQVLDILAERSLRAIFFAVANRVAGDAAARALLTRMVGDCHRVGNHSLTHGRPLGELREQETIAEIATAHDILREFTGENFLFRPWGTEGQLDRRCLNRTAVNYLVSGKHTCVLWNSVPRDWADPVGWIDRALADVEVIVGQHDERIGQRKVVPVNHRRHQMTGADEPLRQWRQRDDAGDATFGDHDALLLVISG